MTAFARTAALYGREARAQIVSSFRTPQFLIPSVALPVMFYALFGVALAKHQAPHMAQWLLATYSVFAAIGPSIFGFGVYVANERESGVIALKRVSPMPQGAYVAAKLAASLARRPGGCEHAALALGGCSCPGRRVHGPVRFDRYEPGPSPWLPRCDGGGEPSLHVFFGARRPVDPLDDDAWLDDHLGLAAAFLPPGPIVVDARRNDSGARCRGARDPGSRHSRRGRPGRLARLAAAGRLTGSRSGRRCFKRDAHANEDTDNRRPPT
jgi:hypothetical protein